MMNRTAIVILSAVLFQFVVLSGMYVSAALPLWTGTEVKIKTIPVDPRSLFRGNYATLRYPFSTIESTELRGAEDLRNGEVIYITLKPEKGGLHEFAGASLEKPESGVYLRGRLQNRNYSDSDILSLKYGVEAFFAPKETALALEEDLRDGGVAVLMIADDDRARLKNVIAMPSDGD